MLCAYFSFGQKPNILCTQVNEDGSTTIFYQTVTIPNFDFYVISVFDNDSLAYVRIGTEPDMNVGTYTDYSRNANLGQVQYMVRSNPNDFAFGNTIHLTINPINTSSFELHWTSPSISPTQPLVGTENQKYTIYRRFASQSNTWNLIDSTNNLSYIDNFLPTCSDTVYYKIELPNSFGCVSRSNIKSSFVGDNEIPIEPIVLCSSVDLMSQKLVLSWIPSLSVDTKGYVICGGSPCIAIDTIMGKTQNSFICDTCNVENVFSLAIMAFDSCFNTSLRSNYHKNIVLSYTREACTTEINLNWTSYFGDPLDVSVYNLYVSQNDGNYTLYETFLPSQHSLIFNANPLVEKYGFYIEALLNNTEKSNSNKVISSQTLPKQVEFAHIRKASVSDDNSSIELSFYVDASLVVRGYDLYRSNNKIDYTLIKSINYSGNSSFNYIDTPTTTADKSIYYYKLQVPDQCELLYKSSNIMSTIQLSVDASDAEMNILSWNDLIGWESIINYDIYRVDENFPFGNQLGTVLSAELGYEDNTSSMITASDKILYYLIAHEEGSSPDGQTMDARSSTASVVKESLIFIPNAFCPTDIVNNTFKPYCSFIKSGSYKFKILSRWGEVIFETTQMNIGWDGRFKGQLCSAQSYVYVVEFVNSEGKKEKKSGIVNLIN